MKRVLAAVLALAAAGYAGCASRGGISAAPLPALSLRVPPPAGLTPRPAPATAATAPCRVTGTIAQAFRGDDGVALRATRDGAPFADMTFVTGEHVALTLLGSGRDGDARLEAEVEHVSIAAWTRRDAFLYEPAASFAFDGYYAPYAEDRSRWSYDGADQFRAELRAPAGLRPVDGSHVLRATRPCEAMQVAAAWSDDHTLFAAAPLARIDLAGYEAASLPVGASVALSTAPGGPPVAFLEPAAPMLLQVRDAPDGATAPSADLAYVAWDTTEALVFGWVERASLGPIQGGGGYGRGSSSCGARFLSHQGPRHFRRCQSEIPLLVRTTAAGEPSVVGTVGHEALLRTSGSTRVAPGFTEVAAQMAGFSMSLRDGAAFLVRTEDLAACPDVVVVDD